MAVERYEKKKNAQITKAQREIDAIFKVAAQEAATIAGTIRKPNPDKPFSFQDYPQTRARIAKLEEWMAEEIAQSISNNVDKEWEIAEQSGQELTSDFLRSTYEDVSNAPAAFQARYFRNNTEAHDAFLARTINGMGLSERVWRLTAQCRQEMEMAIDIGLGEGQSAQEMSRSIRKYLKEPDKLFRRVRDKHGNLVLSKAALAYHPGQGVYRSSYKNALRLTVTEGNMAYRTADHLKWQQLDFVVGIKIGLSNNHTLNGVPFHDICDELAGRYPKDFKFTGWHPFCRCIATTILMTPEEFKANEEAFLDGKEPAVRSKNEVDDVPPQFKKWRKENAKKIKSAKSLPYFVRDNEQYFKRGKITKSAAKGVKESRALNEALQQVTDPAILREQARQAVLAAAKARQANRTPEEIAAIKARWEQRAAERRKAAILENARLRHEARTYIKEEEVKKKWRERTIRNARYIPDNKSLSLEERVKNIHNAIDALFGDSQNIPEWNYWDWWKRRYDRAISSKDTSMLKVLNDSMQKRISGGIEDMLYSINHLRELEKTSNVNMIPTEWRRLFDGYMAKIRKADITKVGYGSLYTEIEAAYNIYRLSISPSAIKYGLSNISPKMHYQLFDDFKKVLKIDITKTMPKKSFYDAMEEFIPLSIKGTRGEGCYYSPKFKHVRIPINLKDTRQRLVDSEIYRTKILYHEFGHAMDYLSKTPWRKRQDWQDLFKRFEVEVNKDKGKALEEALREKGKYALSADFTEQLGAYADTLQSLVVGHRYVWHWGHSVSYWKGDKMLAEFISHACENYWGGNALFEELYKDLFDEMCKMVEKTIS